MFEQVLEREPDAGEIEENLIECALRVPLASRTVLLSAAISGEALREHSADQYARRNSSVSGRFLDPFQQLRRQAHRVWNLRHRLLLTFSRRTRRTLQ